MMLYNLVAIFSLLSGIVRGSGEFVILKSPPSIKFTGNEAIDADIIPDVFLISLGFTPSKASNWPGVEIENPFDLAESVVVLVIEGVSSIGKFKNGLATYPLHDNQHEYLSWGQLLDRIKNRNPRQNSTLQRTELGIDSLSVDNPTTEFLSLEQDEDIMLLQDIEELKSRLNGIAMNPKIDGSPDIYWFVLHSLHVLADVHGADHPATEEAVTLVKNTLSDLSEKLQNAYKNRVLVAAIISDKIHSRQTRQAAQYEATNGSLPGNLATQYSDDYPAIFNIILWFSVAFVFSLIAICYFIAVMDPGRDSIIYRMTSSRIKKDN